MAAMDDRELEALAGVDQLVPDGLDADILMENGEVVPDPGRAGVGQTLLGQQGVEFLPQGAVFVYDGFRLLQTGEAAVADDQDVEAGLSAIAIFRTEGMM